MLDHNMKQVYILSYIANSTHLTAYTSEKAAYEAVKEIVEDRRWKYEIPDCSIQKIAHDWASITHGEESIEIQSSFVYFWVE